MVRPRLGIGYAWNVGGGCEPRTQTPIAKGIFHYAPRNFLAVYKRDKVLCKPRGNGISTIVGFRYQKNTGKHFRLKGIM